MKPGVLALALLIGTTDARADQKVIKEQLVVGGAKRTYYMYVPESAPRENAPLIVLLHGSGRDGRSLLDKWQPLGRKEGIALAGPEALDRQFWAMNHDGPEFLYQLVEAIKAKHAVDPRRVYLFGHSAGAEHALMMAVLESEYFAAVAVHAGALRQPNFLPFIQRAPRKTPIAIWVGTNDTFFPLDIVRATRDALRKGGFNAELTEISGHTHWYYDRAPEINKGAWGFLKPQRLESDPRYQQYEIP